MKKLILVLGLVLGAQAWAGIFNYGDYADGEQQICLRDQGKVRCWSTSSKSAFLVDVTNLAKDWLKKVK